VNGSGKSTITELPQAQLLLGGVRAINPDERTQAAIVKYQFALEPANLIGVLDAELRVWRALAERRTVAVETVLSTDKYFAAVTAATQLGFHTTLIYIALPGLQYSIERVAQRVKRGGHDVPRQKLQERWPKSLANFVKLAPMVRDVLVFSNRGVQPQLVAQKTDGGPLQLILPEELPAITARLRAAAGDT
jgi:predicted ABC-type ATPase